MITPRMTLVTVLCALLSQGCVTHWQGKEMRSDILALRGQVEHLVEDHRAQKAALSKKLSALEKRLERLDRHLDKSIGNLRTTSANSGSTIDEMRQIVQDLRGELAEVKFKIERKQQQIDAIAPPNAEPLPSGRRALFTYGAKHFEKGDCAKSIRAFVAFADQFKTDSNNDNALAMVGECLNQQGEYREALRTLKVIIEKHPKGEKVDDALYLMHESLVALGKCSKAKMFLKQVLTQFPKSNRLKSTKKALKNLGKRCRD